jgi:hypothetical protein
MTQRSHGLFIRTAGTLGLAVATAAVVHAQQSAGPGPAAATRPAAATKPAAVTRPTAAAKPPVPPPTVDGAVAALVAEAEARYRDDVRQNITIARPHPAVAKLGPEHAGQALLAMKGKLTGDPLKDAFVRYHLMDVVNRALPTASESFIKQLLDLAPLVPADLVVEHKPWWVYDPPAIGNRYRQLIESVALQIGFPPFRRRVDAPESFQYMDGPQRAKAEAAYAEAQSLKGKFKETASVENHTYNFRMTWTNWLIRQYRGELLYAMVAQGDVPALDRITDAVAGAAGNDPVRATDLTSFLNAAYFNGLLGKFDEATLKRTAAKLRQAAAASERAAAAAASKAAPVRGAGVAGPTMSVGWFNGGGRWRQVAESMFTLVFGIENKRVPKPVAMDQMVRPGSELPGVVGKPATQPAVGQSAVTPDAISLELIDQAIDRGLAALDRLRPPDVDLNYCSYLAEGLPANHWYGDFTLPGQGALTTWAMLVAGESPNSPWMKRRLDWSLCFDSPTTYDRAMRLLLLSQVRYQKVEPWLKRDAAWLLDTMTDKGNWEVRNTGTRSKDFGDNANGQYAVLGMWAAAQSGIEIPVQAWQKVDQYWRQGQRPPGAPGDGAWAVTSSAALKKGANLNDFSNRVSAPMTAGGVMSMYLSEMYLLGSQRADVGQTLSPELLRGLQWLDENFSLADLDGDQDFYYYMWAIQNVGGATGFRTFHGVDWFREVTAKLLSTQRADGQWTGPKGPHVSTAFALLYLARARGPLAICKLRFDPAAASAAAAAVGKKPPAAGAAAGGAKKPAVKHIADMSARELAKANAWNNRPNDLYNFATEVSRSLEVPTSWQIGDLDQPVYELAETPLLYLATDKAFKLPPAQVERLKEYLDAGGTLVCVPEGRNLLAATASMKSLATELCPGVEPVRRTEKDAKHPFYALAARVKAALPTLSYETKIRPRVVIVEKDVGRDLQANSGKDREAFNLLLNLYLFATGKEPARPRIAGNYLVQKSPEPKVRLPVARVKLGGEYDPEPLALPQLKAMMADRHGLGLDLSAAAPEELSASTKVAFLTLSPAGAAPTDAQAAALKKWVDAGGTLWVDAAGGHPAAVEKVDALTAAMGLADADLRFANDQPVFTGDNLYRGYNVTAAGAGSAPKPQTPGASGAAAAAEVGASSGSGPVGSAGAGTSLRPFRHADGEKVTLRVWHAGGRPAVYVARGDVTSGLAGMNHWGIAGYTATASRRMVANSLLGFAPPPPPPATKPATQPATGPATRPAVPPTARAG